MRLIVADASPLIVLAHGGLLSVLKDIVGEIVIPQTVHAECTLEMMRPGAQAIHAGVDGGLINVRPDVAGRTPVIEAPQLDAGERAAIALAFVLDCPILMDERLGREAARRQGLAVIGSIGVLLEAKRRGAIPAIGPHLEAWREWGYFISESLLKAALEKAGEN